MISPHHLHALAAAWSLHAALARLTKLTEDEATQILAECLEAADSLRSPSWGSRRSGGHSDPVSGLLLASQRTERINRWATLAERAERRLTGIAGMLRTPADLGPLGQIITAIPQLQPGTAAVVHRHLVDEDTWVRAAVGLSPDRKPLPGVACPHCGERQLVVQAAGPVEAWTVVCATGRLCVGRGCPCGMPGAVEGAAHIWPRAAVLGAVAGPHTNPLTRPTRGPTMPVEIAKWKTVHAICHHVYGDEWDDEEAAQAYDEEGNGLCADCG
ncbi:hypothetical protein OOK41_00130 [Micromonospora sp. NBC_01655]|uniref:hypothetical protein n=1 Tax=Micromonospora sp. NBC_01655 TaxID=2975983 RepID=UPI00224D6381|nr:hypothetical protein [Micromonospora sp. NBC_01655]MCX4468738.1 hypothetical protein [Micromonospora sp. NBC_01655]